MKIILELDGDHAALLCGTLMRAANQYPNSPNQQHLYEVAENAVGAAEKAENADLFVQLRGLDCNTIGFIQGVEKALDDSLRPLGFSRQQSSKSSETTQFLYRQFAATLR